ncbi:DUF4124 domain-containing protein [Piscinibacter sakaiensis]|uniref:DUF4124 domain-containing protein n=1 Tax=Piscinibacter sakaiensis TaxID=1547922 RepID=UPI003AAA56DB
MHHASRSGTLTAPSLALAIALGLPFAAAAQYKVVNPDGSVTFTDRAPVKAPGKVVPIETAAGPSATANASLPFELRQVASRYPVTLYVQRPCEPCDAGRQLLRQRGIPYAEKLVGAGEGDALQAATGAKQIPALTIGSQVLHGFSPDQWSSYLDAAGYPKQSRLPANYAAPAPQPLVPAVAERPAVTAAPAPAPQTPAAPPPAPGGIRF